MAKKSARLDLQKLLFHSGYTSLLIGFFFILFVFTLGFRLGRSWNQRLVNMSCPTSPICLIPPLRPSR